MRHQLVITKYILPSETNLHYWSNLDQTTAPSLTSSGALMYFIKTRENSWIHCTPGPILPRKHRAAPVQNWKGFSPSLGTPACPWIIMGTFSSKVRAFSKLLMRSDTGRAGFSHGLLSEPWSGAGGCCGGVCGGCSVGGLVLSVSLLLPSLLSGGGGAGLVVGGGRSSELSFGGLLESSSDTTAFGCCCAVVGVDGVFNTWFASPTEGGPDAPFEVASAACCCCWLDVRSAESACCCCSCVWVAGSTAVAGSVAVASDRDC